MFVDDTARPRHMLDAAREATTLARNLTHGVADTVLHTARLSGDELVRLGRELYKRDLK
jgi:hypothetical protein